MTRIIMAGMDMHLKVFPLIDENNVFLYSLCSIYLFLPLKVKIFIGKI